MDIIVYDSSKYPTVFSSGDFVIVRPESVHAVIEVKGFLRTDKSDEFMDFFIDFGTKWQTCFHYYRQYRSEAELPIPKPGLFLMCWDVAVRKDGARLGNGKSLRENIVKFYKNKVPLEQIRLGGFPVLSNAYIYNDCCVDSTRSQDLKNNIAFGYSTRRGKFVEFVESEAKLGKDMTLSSLIARIQYGLETPFNPKFAYFDQTRNGNVLPHEHKGFEKWLEDEDIKFVS